MNEKRSMRIFWISLCLLLLSGAVIIAAVQYRSHKKSEAEGLGGAQSSEVQALDGLEDTGQAQEDKNTEIHQTDSLHSETGSAAQDAARPASSPVQDYEFELKITDGYLDVYYYHTQNLYLHTGIPQDMLTGQQAQEITDGKYFLNEQELYGYLESCTS